MAHCFFFRNLLFIYFFFLYFSVACCEKNKSTKQPTEEESSKVTSGPSEAAAAAAAKVATLACFNPAQVVDAGGTTSPTDAHVNQRPNPIAATSSSLPSSGWCGCFKRCNRSDKTTLVVETIGENHSLLPNHLNEQQQQQQQNSGYFN